MYNTKYYSFKDKKYIYKTIFSQNELKTFKEVLNDYTDVEYSKLYVKPLDIKEEYKYSSSPNSIGFDAIKEIEESGDKYYVIELVQEEMEEMYGELFKASIFAHAKYKTEIKRRKEELEESIKETDRIREELKWQMGIL